MAVSPFDIPARKCEQDTQVVERIIASCDKKLTQDYEPGKSCTFWFNPGTSEYIIGQVFQAYLDQGWSLSLEERPEKIDQDVVVRLGLSFHGTAGAQADDLDALGQLDALASLGNFEWKLQMRRDYSGPKPRNKYVAELYGPLVSFGDSGHLHTSTSLVNICLEVSADDPMAAVLTLNSNLSSALQQAQKSGAYCCQTPFMASALKVDSMLEATTTQAV